MTNTFKVIKIERKFWDNNKGPKGGNATEVVYIGFTQQTLEQFLQTFKSAIKDHPENYSKKIQELRVDHNTLSISQICGATKDNLAATVNKYIDKFDTINSGWNTEYRV